MKRIRITCCALLFVLAVLSLAGCSNGNDMNSNGTTAATQPAGGSTGSGGESAGFEGGETGGAGMMGGNGGTTTNGGAGNGGAVNGATQAADDETAGVIDGLINDVERGVEDLTGETQAKETTKAR